MPKRKIRASRQQAAAHRTVAVIGLGYVGLPLACLASEKGWNVIGLARNQQKIDLINRRQSPIAEPLLNRWVRRTDVQATADATQLTRASVIVICVPTPVDHHNNPDFGPIISASRTVAKHLRRGQLVILESTVSPGVSEEIVLPILLRSTLKVGRDFWLAHCPERIDPGNRQWTVRNIPRVVGGYDRNSRDRAVKFYRSILEADVKPMASLKEAEAVKIIENSFRDVNIAFVNEIAMSFERLGIDALDVIRGAATKPFAFLPHWPSAGVGGHCIPVDPYYLIERARKSGFDHTFLKLARSINNRMPKHAVDRLTEALRSSGRSLRGTRVGVLGLAYKRNVSDTRESPSYRVIDLLKRRGATVLTFDPYIPAESSTSSIQALLGKSDALILMTDHDAFSKITPRLLSKYKIAAIVDGKNLLDKAAFDRSQIAYRGIGRA